MRTSKSYLGLDVARESPYHLSVGWDSKAPRGVGKFYIYKNKYRYSGGGGEGKVSGMP